MSNFNIPSPGQVPTEPSDYTKQEIADLAPSKRNVVLYEREIEYLKSTVSYLQGVLADFRAENAELLRAERTSIESKVKLETVRRSKLEMYVGFALGTFLLTIGGALLGYFPAAPNSVPWQHAVGWSLIITGAIFGLVSRSIIQFVLHRFPKIAEDWMQ